MLFSKVQNVYPTKTQEYGKRNRSDNEKNARNITEAQKR